MTSFDILCSIFVVPSEKGSYGDRAQRRTMKMLRCLKNVLTEDRDKIVFVYLPEKMHQSGYNK